MYKVYTVTLNVSANHLFYDKNMIFIYTVSYDLLSY